MNSVFSRMGVLMAATTALFQPIFSDAKDRPLGQWVMPNGGGPTIPPEGFVRFLKRAQLTQDAKVPTIAVVLYSSEIPTDVGMTISQKLKRAARELGIEIRIQLLEGPPSEEVERARVRKILLNADGIFFSGGDQKKHMKGFLDAGLLPSLEYSYWVREVPVMGTSAGTAILSESMIAGDGFPLTRGLAFLPGIVIDQHFLDSRPEELLPRDEKGQPVRAGRERRERLYAAQEASPKGYLAIGVAENGAILCERTPGTSQFRITAIGDKNVHVRRPLRNGTFEIFEMKPGQSLVHDYAGISVAGCQKNLQRIQAIAL